MSRVHNLQLLRWSRIWTCDITFTVTTAEQFTDLTACVRGVGRWWLTAAWRAWRAYRREAKRLRAKPGEREAKGWAA